MINRHDKKQQRIRRITSTAICVALCAILFSSMPVYATSTGINEVDKMFTNFTTMVESFVKWVGRAVLLFGGVQFGMSFQNHDASQRSTSLLFILSGVIIALAPEIIAYITG